MQSTYTVLQTYLLLLGVNDCCTCYLQAWTKAVEVAHLGGVKREQEV